MELKMKDKKVMSLVVAGEYGTENYLLLEHPEGMDVSAAMARIKENVAANKETYEDICVVPDQYFEKEGIRKLPFSIVETSRGRVGAAKVYEEAGIHIACCEDCDSFDCGSCTHYGGYANPYSTECDRLHGYGVFQLVYKDEEEGEELFVYPYIRMEEPVDAAEAARLMDDDDFPFLRDFLLRLGADVKWPCFQLVKKDC